MATNNEEYLKWLADKEVDLLELYIKYKELERESVTDHDKAAYSSLAAGTHDRIEDIRAVKTMYKQLFSIQTETP